ncbi:MAG: flippase-like domain-containing protein, partial [Acetobacterium sp.]|nr:flippase-like domain-containing protein [Bacillota bacterium]MCG2730324.1 flippase-like domain-containing protein [Acetobacterium sp.]
MDHMKIEKKSRLSKIWEKYSNIIFLIFLIGATTLIILTQVDPETFINTIKQANGWYLLLGIVCVFVYWALEAFMLFKLMLRDNPKETFHFAWTLTIVGQYYNLLDPSSTGGQPVQLYEMSKRNYKLGSGTAVLIQKYALYQITTTFLALISIIFCITELHQSLDAAKWLIIIGLILNVGAVILIIILVFRPKSAKAIILGCVNFLLKIRILKNPEKYYRKVDHFVGEYKIAIEELKSHKIQTFQMFIISIIQILIFYSINYWVYRSLGLSAVNAITIISLQAILYVAVAFVPTPGAAGGAEAGFLLIFGPIFGPAYTPVAMILWRMISFYFILLFGGIYLSIHSIKMGKG